jgi:AsmA protein
MKLFLKLLAGLVTLFIVTIVILLTVIDPNDYKTQIQTQVKQAINRDLLINGDLNWSFYPQLGFSSGEIELQNPAGFNRKNLAKIESAAIEIAVLPLFKGEIKIGELTLNGLVLNLITNKDGSSNLDNMLAEKTSETPEQTEKKQPTSENTGFFAVDKVQLAGINIKNTVIEVQDLKAASSSKLDIDHIRLGKFSLGEETDLSVLTELIVAQTTGHIELQATLIVAPDFSTLQINNLNLQTIMAGDKLPNGKISSVISSNIIYDLTNSKADLTDFVLQVDKINLQGTLSVQTKAKTKIRFTLQGNEWDLSPYLATTPEKPVDKKVSTDQQAATTAEQEPDLSFLEDLDVKGTLTIAGIKASGITIGKVDTNIQINKGKAQVTPLTAQLYQGLLTLNAWVDNANGANKYQLASSLQDVAIRPLLIDAADIDLLSGKTAFNFKASGQGLTTEKIKSGLAGSGDFKLLDGELYGVNIPQEIRSFKAKLTGKPAPTEDNIKKTDFASLSGEFNIKKGIVDNNKLLMLSPVMRLDGLGLANILNESLDYKLGITPLSKSDEKTEFDDLGGVTIPLLIKGSFTDPKFSLDMEGALKEKLKMKTQELKEKAKNEIKEEGNTLIKKGLGKLFN